jgi:predicted dehydrogenase
MVRVGIVGIGFMGMVHYLSYAKVRGAKVVALSEVNTKRLAGDWRGIKGNFGPEGTQMDLSGIARYETMEGLFADPNVDVIDICLPPSFHADAVVKALQAGKDVFCEKPMALDIAGTRRMVAAAEKSGKLLMIGHVLPLFPEYEFAYQAATSGKYGKLLGGTFKRVISDPQWLPDYYRPDRVGGPMLDLHIHDAHFIRLLFGMPQGVSTQGRMRGDVVEYFHSQFRFDDPQLVVHATSGVIHQQGRSFTHGYEIHFEKATITFEFAVIDDQPRVLMPVTVLPSKGKVTEPKLGSGDPMDSFQREMTEVAKAVKTRKPPAFLLADLARDAITLCHKQTEAAMKGKPVSIR